jgi:nucleoside phosphorylase
MAQQPRGRHEYQVGWISAVQTEYVVACELLDEEYSSPLAGLPNDNNVYTFGRIGEHHIVLACLPKGKYGLTSATSVAKDMFRSFPSLRFGLMVGIGGGAPTKQQDIRLGDVVVGTPVARTGGVIHYEFGKTIQNQRFERTGYLNAPPQILLNAVNKLSTLHERHGHRILESIDDLIKRNPRLKKYQRPSVENDVLYQSTAIHADSSQLCLGSCSTKADWIVPRPRRNAEQDDPGIHYGLIASADRLMKDATVRDKLAQNEAVLCFEMEAAGLMDHVPCLVVRGICDYSDTHKNDLWQGYAAATAAAYAKELLGVIPPLEAGIPSTTQSQGPAADFSVKQREQILNWISPISAWPRLEELRLNQKLRAGQWVLEDQSFKAWNDSAKSHYFWLHGKIGSGKSTVAASVVRALVRDHQGTGGKKQIAFFFCDRASRSMELVDPSSIINNLVAQLLHFSSIEIPKEVSAEFDAKRGASSLSQPMALKVMNSIINEYDLTTIVIDGLDECPRDVRTSLMEDIDQLVVSCNKVMHVFYSSRRESDIEEFMDAAENALDVVVENEVEVCRFVEDQVEEDFRMHRFHPSCVSIKNDIITGLQRKAQGM